MTMIPKAIGLLALLVSPLPAGSPGGDLLAIGRKYQHGSGRKLHGRCQLFQMLDQLAERISQTRQLSSNSL